MKKQALRNAGQCYHATSQAVTRIINSDFFGISVLHCYTLC